MEPETTLMGTGTAIVLALGSTVALAVLHLLAPRIRGLPLVPEHASVSFAGGIAVSYVFLHLLPELATGNDVLREIFAEEGTRVPLLELGIFAVALAGFCLFFVLERLAQRHSSGSGQSRGVFWTHLGSFAVYNGVITYTMPLTYRTGWVFAVLFTLAMGLHFVLTDRSLEEHYGKWFDRWRPRLFLVSALVLGWLLAWVLAPVNSTTVHLLTAFLAGSVLLNAFKEEIPDARRTSLPWFLTGLALYAALIAGVTLLEHE